MNLGADQKDEIFGILGGMGPLASSEFIKTIYQYNIGEEREQNSPRIMLFSEPTIPDRTEALLRGEQEQLCADITKALDRLHPCGVSRVVLCCVTSHALLSALSDKWREKIISLVDLIIEEISRRKTRHLLLCSNGTRKLKVFENHDRWPEAKAYVALPNDEDQDEIHRIIYGLKKNADPMTFMPTLKNLMTKYSVSRCVAGCTEFHLMSKCATDDHGTLSPENWLDPLIIIARSLSNKSCLPPSNMDRRKNMEEIL